MSPITDRSKLKEAGFAQVRAALVSFEGDCTGAKFDKWPGRLLDEDGKAQAPREYLEVTSENNVPLEITEDLTMDISELWTFRVNCSEALNTIWDDFLASADEHKILVPEGLVGKRIRWKQATREYTIRGVERTSTNYIIDAVVSDNPVAKPVAKPARQEPDPGGDDGGASDPMEIALQIALGKTETEFRKAIAEEPGFRSSPLLALAKAGAITNTLVQQGKLVLVKDGSKNTYALPE